MNKILLVALISLSLALACHPSCNCNANSNECQSCKDSNSSVDSYKRSCPCKSGYYTSSLGPFTCSKSLTIDDNGNQIAAPMNGCQLDIGLVTKNLVVNTDCHFDNSNGSSFVVSQVTLNRGSISITDECFEQYRTKVEYQDHRNNDQWADVPSNRVTAGPAPGQQTMKWPLMEIYQIAIESTYNDQQISNLVSLRISIGHPRRYVRVHSWKLFVHTNRNQVNLFQIDVDLQRTKDCQPGEECIVVADLQTVGKVYTDNTYLVEQAANHLYEVGQVWYARITFADPTYTKKLIFQNLYYKNDANLVFNFNTITTRNWVNGGLNLELILVEPSLKAYIQVNMLIDSARRQLRELQNNNQQGAQQQFSTTILNPKASQANNNQNSGMTMIFCLVNLFAFLFLY